MLRKTKLSLSDATAAFATTNATVALSVLSFPQVRLTQNFPAMSFSVGKQLVGVNVGHAGPTPLRLCPDPVAARSGLLANQLMPGHAAIRRNIGRCAGVARDQLEHLAGNSAQAAP